MKAFHGDTKIKKKYLNRVAAHRLADELHKGYTGQQGKGCAVWCTLDKYDHKAYEGELGIPEWLAHLEDTIFEGLSETDSQRWPEQFLKAIKPGVDLESVKNPFLIYVLSTTFNHFSSSEHPDVANSIHQVIDLLSLNADPADLQEASVAASDAAYAAYAASDAAYAASRAAYAAYAAGAASDAARAASEASDAAYAAYAASDAAYAAYAAYAASRAAYAAYAASAASRAAYLDFSKHLLKLLRSCK